MPEPEDHAACHGTKAGAEGSFVVAESLIHSNRYSETSLKWSLINPLPTNDAP